MILFLKDGKFYVVEVKTNNARVTAIQRKELEECKSFGFYPLLLRTKVRITAKMEDIKVTSF